MYHNNLVATIKVGGKILRENKNLVTVPFGTEYTIFVKNMSTVRALVKVSIDGEDMTGSTWLIVEANGNIELERSIKNGNMTQGNRFKFIERTGAVEAHRGIKAEDGLVRIEYKFEKSVPSYNYNDIIFRRDRRRDDRWPIIPERPYFIGNMDLYKSDGIIGGNRHTKSSPLRGTMSPSGSSGRGITGQSISRSMRSSVSSSSLPEMDSYLDANEAGVTVAGSVSDQKFVTGAYFPTEQQTHVIVLKLVGKVAGKAVQVPLTVDVKPECTSCGKMNKATNKFCSQCGTGLVIV